MVAQTLKRFSECGRTLIRGNEIRSRFVYGLLGGRFMSQKPEKAAALQENECPRVNLNSEEEQEDDSYRQVGPNSRKWTLELAWLTKALELCRKALPTGDGLGNKPPPRTRSVSEILASIQRSRNGIQGWSLSDLTVGLYLIYLQQPSLDPFEDVKGIQITSDTTVQDLIYHIELAKGCYKDSPAVIAGTCMLRENNILKFVKDSSVSRPAYYIAIDPRRRLVILGIRGTHTVYDLITNIVSLSNEEVMFEGYSTHFGMAEAAGWFLTHELAPIQNLLEKYEGFRLRLVGHSLGAAIASLLAVMLRRKSQMELGFSPELVTAIGFATPPCVSKELAESCSDFVSTIVMQDDIIPRLSAAAITRLRDEILQTDWMIIFEKEDWKSMVDLVTNAKQVVSSAQETARKLVEFAKFRGKLLASVGGIAEKSTATPSAPAATGLGMGNGLIVHQKEEAPNKVLEELFIPGTVYYLKRNIGHRDESYRKKVNYFTLWRRIPGEHFQRILLSGNIISDHRCDSHIYALRDVLKGLPLTYTEGIFPSEDDHL